MKQLSKIKSPQGMEAKVEELGSGGIVLGIFSKEVNHHKRQQQQQLLLSPVTESN